MTDRLNGGRYFCLVDNHYLIGLDLGTSALKGVVTTDTGQVLAETSRRNELLEPHPGRVEVEPEALYGRVCAVLRELSGAVPGEVTAVAMAAASGNTLLCSPAGEPRGNIINWMDQRCAAAPPGGVRELQPREVAQAVGWPCVDIFPLAHLAWLREHRAADLEAAGHVGMDTDWLLYRLTGKWCMDPSTATTFHLYDQRAETWHLPFLQRLGLRESQLSQLVPSGVEIGTVQEEAVPPTGLSRRTRLVTGCFDHPAAARAVGVMQPGDLLLSCGTSWVGLTPHFDRDCLLEAEMLCDPFLTAAGGPWAGIFSVPYIGRHIEQYVDQLPVAPGQVKWQVFEACATAAAPGAGGLRLDLREPPMAVEASPENLSRAVMEGAVRLLAEKMSALRPQGFTFGRAVMVGGPAQSRLWPRLLSAAAEVEVEAGGLSAGARGAAMLAGIGAGIYHDEQHALHRWKEQGDG